MLVSTGRASKRAGGDAQPGEDRQQRVEGHPEAGGGHHAGDQHAEDDQPRKQEFHMGVAPGRAETQGRA